MVKPRRHRRDVSVGDHIHEDWRQPMARFTWWMVIYVDGILLGIFWNFMVISWDFIGFHGISWDFMEFHGDFTGFTGDLLVISWWFHGDFMDTDGISWFSPRITRVWTAFSTFRWSQHLTKQFFQGFLMLFIYFFYLGWRDLAFRSGVQVGVCTA